MNVSRDSILLQGARYGFMILSAEVPTSSFFASLPLSSFLALFLAFFNAASLRSSTCLLRNLISVPS